MDELVDLDFIYNLVEEAYSSDNGRPSLDPVMLIKIPLAQCFYGIRSMHQTIKEIELNTAYLWFLGLTLDDKVPHSQPMVRLTTVSFRTNTSFLRFLVRCCLKV